MIAYVFMFSTILLRVKFDLIKVYREKVSEKYEWL